jgi:ABC-type molybdenum transport system ATPase subunit/photorepair protein PhrA
MANLPHTKQSTKKKRTKTKSRGKAKYENVSIDNTTHSIVRGSSDVDSDIENALHTSPSTTTHSTSSNANTTYPTIPNPITTTPNATTTFTTTASITPAQLRCLTIGMELVNRPALVFLDDPFHGLQWHQAEQVCLL